MIHIGTRAQSRVVPSWEAENLFVNDVVNAVTMESMLANKIGDVGEARIEQIS